MVLKISLPSGRHRERRKLNHFDKFLYFLPQRVAIEKRQKLRVEWKILFYPSRGRAREIGFYARFSKIFSFWLRCGATFCCPPGSWLRNGATLEPPDLSSRFAAPIWSQMASKWSHLRSCVLSAASKWCHFEGPFTYSQWEQPFSKYFFKEFLSLTYSRWEKAFGNPFLK